MVQLFKTITLILLLISCLNANNLNEQEIKKLIGRTIIIGFEGQTLNSSLKENIDKYNLGGVILFNKDYKSKKKKNILNPNQLKKLNSNIQNYSKYKMFISIDQEGGKVSRLNPNNGFFLTPSAKDISSKDINQAKKEYQKLAYNLKKMKINLNFAPVVDLNINPNNKVIVQLERSYSKDPLEVVKYASVFIEEQNRYGIGSVIKHFPGHGSSNADSHKGFVDITNTWRKEELNPYKQLIKDNKVDFIMTAHVFNKKLDEEYPATLSYKINTKILREKLKFQGVIISDDLQMKAISEHYSLRERIKLSINAGVNILLFGNQLDKNDLKTIVDTIYNLIEQKEIKLSKIIESNKLIKNFTDKIQ